MYILCFSQPSSGIRGLACFQQQHVHLVKPAGHRNTIAAVNGEIDISCCCLQKWEAPSGCGWDDPCGSGCDSSNCLFCQQSAVPHFSDTQLCQRLASGSFSPTEFAAAAVPGDLDPELLHERKRARIAGSSDISTSHSHLQVLAPSELPSGWRFRAEWTSRNTPAPACFQHLATYSTPTSSHHMNCNILCGMEFTRDGMLLAAAGIAKQVSPSRHLPEACLSQSSARHTSRSCSQPCHQIPERCLAHAHSRQQLLQLQQVWMCCHVQQDVPMLALGCSVHPGQMYLSSLHHSCDATRRPCTGLLPGPKHTLPPHPSASSAPPPLQVRLYSLEQLASGQQVVAQPAAVLRMPSKISCASWSPDAEGVITIGDYDGGLSQVRGAGGEAAGMPCAGSALSC